jgi:glycosyltransferase involved in cell wall biosynthesis
MQNCLFYATTPRWESFGMAALEAMSAGKAVLASKKGGLAAFARGGRNAVLVDPEDPEAVSSALLRLSADAGLRNSLGRKALAAASEYSWVKIADKYLRSAYR